MEDKKAVDFQKSQVMPGRPKRDTVIALALALLPIIAVAAVLLIGDRSGGEAATVAPVAPAAAFDYDEAAQLSAQRWQAMADYYRDNGLLTRDASDAEAVDPADIKFLNGSYRLGLPPAQFKLADESEAYFTQKYWDMAAEKATVEQAEENAAYFTEKYWLMAAEKATAKPVTSERILHRDQHRRR